MPSSKEDIIGRIRALMDKSVENGCTIPEAEAAAAKVSDLITRYHIDQGDIIPKEDKFTKGGVVFKYKGAQNWSRLLATVIASITGTFYAYTKREAFFYGRTSDVKLATYYFQQMQERVTSMGRAEARKQLALGDVDARNDAWFRSYCIGFAKGLRDKMDEAQRSAVRDAERERKAAPHKAGVTSSGSTALMLIDKRADDAYTYAKETEVFGRGAGMRYSRGGDIYGYEAGREASFYDGLGDGSERKRVKGG